MNTLLQSIYKCVQDRKGVPNKPAVLPISSLAEMDDFENMEENRFIDVVSEKKLFQFFLVILVSPRVRTHPLIYPSPFLCPHLFIYPTLYYIY